jgi:hypothetical protein
MSKPRKHKTLADMSLPPEERARGRKPGVTGTPPAQMSHATNPRARRQQRDGERRMAAEVQDRADHDGERIFVMIDEAAALLRRSLGQEADREFR